METILTESQIKSLHMAKAKQSFKTKLNIYLFEGVLKNRISEYYKDFEEYEIDIEILKLYTTKYWQSKKEIEIGDSGKNVQLIYEEIKIWKTVKDELIKDFQIKYINTFNQKIFPFEKFKLFLQLENEDRCCKYCKITEDQIIKLGLNNGLNKKNLRGWSLEIDRKNSNLEYTFDNCVLACYWCNNAKTDEFTEDEFVEIGKEIAKIWNRRLVKK